MRDSTKYKKPTDNELREQLGGEQYEIMVNGATEAPFTSSYLGNKEDGVYVDAATGEPLFTSFDQFESACGWPSFTQPIQEDCVTKRKDASHGMLRMEVRSKAGDFHLGHVFKDGPKEDGGLRYCINGAAIRFIPMEDMEAEGYAYLFPYLNERRKGRTPAPTQKHEPEVCGSGQVPCENDANDMRRE